MLRSFDAFGKPVEGLRTSTTVGGAVTLLAYSCAFVLFVSQLVLYARVQTQQNFQMAESLSSPFLPRPNHVSIDNAFGKPGGGGKGAKRNPRLEMIMERRRKLPIRFKVTFPFMSCDDVEVAHDEARGEAFERMHGRDSYTKRLPSRIEQKEIVRKASVAANGRGVGGGGETILSKGWDRTGGCTVEGTLYVPKVGGMFAITMTKDAWGRVMKRMNDQMWAGASKNPGFKFPDISHHIHKIEFGEPFPLAPNPLEHAQNVVNKDGESSSGLGIANVVVKLVSTKYKRFARRSVDTYQISSTDHMVHPNALALSRSPLLPGLVLSYDFTPLAVHHTESRENFFSFLSSLVSIVGGVFVTVGLVSRLLVNAAAVAKKKD